MIQPLRRNKIVLKMIDIGIMTFWFAVLYFLALNFIGLGLNLTHYPLPSYYQSLLDNLPKPPYTNSFDGLAIGIMACALYVSSAFIYTLPIALVLYLIALLIMLFSVDSQRLLITEMPRK